MAARNGSEKRRCPNHCGRDIAAAQLKQHLEACSGGAMTVDSKEDYVVRLLAEGKTPYETGIALGMETGAVRQTLTRLRRKWAAKTTVQLMVKLSKEGIL